MILKTIVDVLQLLVAHVKNELSQLTQTSFSGVYVLWFIAWNVREKLLASITYYEVLATPGYRWAALSLTDISAHPESE